MRGIGDVAHHTGRHAAIKHPCRRMDLMDMEDEKEAPYIFTYTLVINNAALPDNNINTCRKNSRLTYTHAV